MSHVTKHLVGILLGSLIFGICVGANLVISNNTLFSNFDSVLQDIVVLDPEIHKTAQATTHSEPETADVNDRYLSGWYSFEGSDSLPDVNIISLSEDMDIDQDGNEKIKIYAGVFTRFEDIGDSGYIEAATVNIKEKKVSFRTKKINGFIFHFVGEFFTKKTMGKDGEKLLHGKMTQYRKGKKVAETSGDLSYHEPRCWH
jgi:hypothetical protein